MLSGQYRGSASWQRLASITRCHLICLKTTWQISQLLGRVLEIRQSARGRRVQSWPHSDDWFDALLAKCSSFPPAYPLGIKDGNGKSPMNRGFSRNIIYFYGPFSSKPCLITGGYWSNLLQLNRWWFHRGWGDAFGLDGANRPGHQGKSGVKAARASGVWNALKLWKWSEQLWDDGKFIGNPGTVIALCFLNASLVLDSTRGEGLLVSLVGGAPKYPMSGTRNHGLWWTRHQYWIIVQYGRVFTGGSCHGVYGIIQKCRMLSLFDCFRFRTLMFIEFGHFISTQPPVQGPYSELCLLGLSSKHGFISNLEYCKITTWIWPESFFRNLSHKTTTF